MKLSIFVRNKNISPSSFYRICQYIDYIDSDDIKIYEYLNDGEFNKLRENDKNKFIKKIYKAIYFIKASNRRNNQLKEDIKRGTDIIFIQREIFTRGILPSSKKILESYLKSAKKIVWDFDDNIIQDMEICKFESMLLSKYSKKIIVTSEYLKETLDEEYYKKVKFIPTTDMDAMNIDIQNLKNKRISSYKNEINLIWVGTAGNLKHLEDIIEYLDEAAKQIKLLNNKDVNLKVVCNANLEYNTKFLKIENIPWTRNQANIEMENSHIGLMPLKENFYTLGKAGFKAVQYIGRGIPTIVSRVGFNNEVIVDGYNGFLALEKEDWINGILKLSMDEAYWSSISANSRKYWEEKFNTIDVIDELNYELCN